MVCWIEEVGLISYGEKMGDWKKDIDDMLKMRATGKDSLRISASLTATVIRTFYERIKKENPRLSKHELLKKLNEEIFYGRRDNH